VIRFIVVNVHPTNEIIKSDTLQRFMMIGTIINQQRHPHHKQSVLAALFFDWFSYNQQKVSSIMLVEPAMLLMYKSCENNPGMTDYLVDYLYQAVHSPKLKDSKFEMMRSIQRVLHDCQAKGVVKDLKKLINHNKLKSET
jgi:hypothetical protein